MIAKSRPTSTRPASSADGRDGQAEVFGLEDDQKRGSRLRATPRHVRAGYRFGLALARCPAMATVSALMSTSARGGLARNPIVVAIASWLLPGAGYWLVGQRDRALTVGITVLALFVLGLLIGGVRLIDVPGYGDHGKPLMVVTQGSNEQVTENPPPDARAGWVMAVHPLDEIRNKPWAIAQVMLGPVALAAGAGSVIASHPSGSRLAIGARSHSRTNELGTLYTAVAGMLNLLAIIDSAHRASRGEGR